jgi:hypothetical protein
MIARPARRQRTCAYCAAPLGDRYGVDAWGDAFCAEHHDEWPRCRFCQRLVPEAQSASDRRAVCRTCRDAAVADDRTASILLPPVVAWLRGEGVTLTRSVRLLVDLVTPGELQHVDRGGPDVLGQARVLRRGRTPTRISLLLLNGLPSPSFEGVAVHELGHAWLACREITGLSLRAEEGFCEMLAWRWYTWRDTPESRFHARRIAHNADPVYGDGFQDMRQRVEIWGFNGVLGYLKARRTMPPASGAVVRQPG